MTLDDFKARLSPDGKLFVCPGHADRRGSLSVGQGHSGRIVLKCFAGCETTAIVAAMGLSVRDLFAGNGTTRPPNLNHADITRRNDAVLAAPCREVARYPFTDEDGALLYWEVRFEPKDFRPLRADGKWTLTGVRRVLYRLPDTIEAVALGRAIHLTEGCKDADTLVALGYVATTVAGGSNTELTSEMCDALRDASIIIHADNDAPGRKCAERRAAALHGTAASVRVASYA